MYDTILQMVDGLGTEKNMKICADYITKKAWNDFKFIAGVVNNLNRQIVIMQSDKKIRLEILHFLFRIIKIPKG